MTAFSVSMRTPMRKAIASPRIRILSFLSLFNTAFASSWLIPPIKQNAATAEAWASLARLWGEPPTRPSMAEHVGKMD